MSEDRLGKTYSFDVCSNCPLNCCQNANPPLTPNRVKLVLHNLREKNMRLSQPITFGEYTHPSVDESGICVFLDKNTRRCLVHQAKPETCKAGPITFDINLKTAKIEWFLKNGDICALAEQLSSYKESLAIHLEVAKTEIMQLISELNAEELRAILKIPEPDTYKIGENSLPKNVADKLGIG